jgi:hypothetical protein
MNPEEYNDNEFKTLDSYNSIGYMKPVGCSTVEYFGRGRGGRGRGGGGGFRHHGFPPGPRGGYPGYRRRNLWYGYDGPRYDYAPIVYPTTYIVDDRVDASAYIGNWINSSGVKMLNTYSNNILYVNIGESEIYHASWNGTSFSTLNMTIISDGRNLLLSRLNTAGRVLSTEVFSRL